MKGDDETKNGIERPNMEGQPEGNAGPASSSPSNTSPPQTKAKDQELFVISKSECKTITEVEGRVEY